MRSVSFSADVADVADGHRIGRERRDRGQCLDGVRISRSCRHRCRASWSRTTTVTAAGACGRPGSPWLEDVDEPRSPCRRCRQSLDRHRAAGHAASGEEVARGGGVRLDGVVAAAIANFRASTQTRSIVRRDARSHQSRHRRRRHIEIRLGNEVAEDPRLRVARPAPREAPWRDALKNWLDTSPRNRRWPPRKSGCVHDDRGAALVRLAIDSDADQSVEPSINGEGWTRRACAECRQGDSRREPPA